MSFTSGQNKAIESRQNTVVVAGAGAGKTRTLVERCIQRLLDPTEPVAMNEMLVVTFTEAAAAEMRHRIQQRLEKELEARPDDERLLQQIVLLDSACISTLHSFCWRIVREHFYELDLDPAAGVLQEQQSHILFSETLDELLREHYEGLHANSPAVQKYILEQENGKDDQLRKLIREIHNFTQSRPDPAGWFARQRELLEKKAPEQWQEWLIEALQEWCGWWLPLLRSLPAENSNAAHCVELLEGICKSGSIEKLHALLGREAIACWPKGKKGEHSKPFLGFFKKFKELAEFTVTSADSGRSALEEDWEWSRETLKTVLTLAEQFEGRFAESKRDRGAVDFHDLEQFALKLLWDAEGKRPTETAVHWQERFKLIFVDEYQDINQAQDLIIRAISRERDGGNRFLVGDIKQSIYRFRQGDPAIFRAYIGKAGWNPAILSDNFRSHEAILNFANPVFGWLMQEEIGGVVYGEEAKLKFENRPKRAQMSAAEPTGAHVEIHLLIKDAEVEESEPSEDADLVEWEDAEKEAILAGGRLKELHDSKHRIFDEGLNAWRDVAYGDMVILMRAPRGKAEAYARAFDRIGVPLQVKRNVFYTAPEVSDLVNLLTILDNPLQDIPFIAVLRSPLAGLSANELAMVRVVNRDAPFALAVNRYLEIKKQQQTAAKLQVFMERFWRWRKQGVNCSLSQRLEAILAETHYDDWIKAQPRGGQRYANIQQLIKIARQFDELKGEGLYQFVRHVQEVQGEIGDIEPAPLEATNAVRLMSVHQSKGLEFPVVLVADTGKGLNFMDARGSTLLHEKYGLCTKIQPPGRHQSYNSLPLILARHQERIAIAAEEMRLLYVALTRARNLLICTGSIGQKSLAKWSDLSTARPCGEHLLQDASWLKWMGAFLQMENPEWTSSASGAGEWWSWRVHQSPPLEGAAEGNAGSDQPGLSPEQLARLRERFERKYPFLAATDQPAKTSVTALRRNFSDMLEEESALAPFLRTGGGKDGRERGLAHHHFLQHLDLQGPLDTAGLSAQAGALVEAKVLAREEFDYLNFKNLAAFWASPVGQQILANRTCLHRELPFTFRVGNEELEKLSGGFMAKLDPGEFVVVQGIADLVVVRPEEIWLLDFKTDSIEAAQVPATAAHYRLQIELYSLALESIYHRPVTQKHLHFFVPGRTVQF